MITDVTHTGGAGGEPLDRRDEVDGAVLHQVSVDDREGGLEPEHPARGDVPLDVLGLRRVRRVVSGHRVDRPIGQCRAQCLDVLGRPHRRVDLEAAVVGGDDAVVETEVVRGDLGGHAHAALLGLADQLRSLLGRHVRDVEPGTDAGGEDEVAGDHDLLGLVRPAGQTEQRRHPPLVHLGVRGEVGVLAVVHDHGVEPGRVLQRTPHDQRVGDGLAVVGEAVDTGLGAVQFAELGELLAAQPLGDRAHREHVDQADLAATAPDHLGHGSRVADRVGVGHRAQPGVAAGRTGSGTGGDVLGVLEPGLAQVGVQVDEASRDDLAGDVHDRRARVVQTGAHLGDRLAVDEHVGSRLGAGDGVDDPAAAKQDAAHAPPPTVAGVWSAAGASSSPAASSR